MIGIAVHGARELDAELEKATHEIEAAKLRALEASVIMVRNELARRMSAAGQTDSFWGKQSPPGAYIGARSGQTLGRLSPGRVWTSGTVAFGAVGHPDKHVEALEFGYTIRPTSGQFLRVPTINALTASGVDRYTGMSIRQIPGARIIRTKAGKLWAVRTVGSGRGARTELLYLLVRSVKMPEKRVFETVRNELADPIRALFESEVDVVLERGGLRVRAA